MGACPGPLITLCDPWNSGILEDNAQLVVVGGAFKQGISARVKKEDLLHLPSSSFFSHTNTNTLTHKLSLTQTHTHTHCTLTFGNKKVIHIDKPPDPSVPLRIAGPQRGSLF